MEWYYIVILIIALLLIFYIIFSFVVAFYLTNMVTHPYCLPYDEAFQKELSLKKFDLKEYEELKKEKIVIKSKYGYNLKGLLLYKCIDVKFQDNKERFVIMSHGWTSNKFAMLGYAFIYLKQGLNVVIYDHRNHLESDRIITTMGDKEADDLETVIEYVKSRFTANIIIGTHGESMGAATVLVHAGRYHSIDFVIEDCGYNNLKELLTYQCGIYHHLPTFPAMFFSKVIFKITTKSSFKKVNCEFSVSTCDDIPICFIHGSADKFVPSYMVYKLYDCKPGYKEIHLYDSCTHANSFVKEPIKYQEDVLNFLKQIKII